MFGAPFAAVRFCNLATNRRTFKMRSGAYAHSRKLHWLSSGLTDWTETTEVDNRRIGDDDIVYVDLGPVFEAWEADYGRTFVVGADPVKHALNRDLGVAFAQGKEFFRSNRDLTAGALYDFIAGRAQQLGWTFGAPTAGHLVGHFPHERDTANATRFSIRRGNTQSLREPDDQGRIRHWILEVHFVDKERQIGGFLEELLTIDGPSVS